jgi:hypothetical protein
MVGAWASLHNKIPRTSHIQTSRYVVDLLIWTESASGVAGNINFRHHVAFDLAAQMVSLVPSKRHSRRAKAYMEAGLAGCWLRIHCVLGELS